MTFTIQCTIENCKEDDKADSAPASKGYDTLAALRCLRPREATGELSSLVELRSDHSKTRGRQLDRGRQGGGLPHEGLGERRSDDHRVIAQVLAEE